jgi:hypothetical protein
MSRKWLTRLIAPAAVLVWIGLGWLSYQQGQLRGVVIAALTGVVIVVVSVAIWRRQRRFDRALITAKGEATLTALLAARASPPRRSTGTSSS